ncbi:hypothetical protein ABEB36_006742 [Hypothenemus hampei]|uniref:Uncharacterized protein n=1 Tax=Hypothenemus hampei TaxID=57062 RepID=A0ABD1ERL4_HYPHA
MFFKTLFAVFLTGTCVTSYYVPENNQRSVHRSPLIYPQSLLPNDPRALAIEMLLQVTERSMEDLKNGQANAHNVAELVDAVKKVVIAYGNNYPQPYTYPIIRQVNSNPRGQDRIPVHTGQNYYKKPGEPSTSPVYTTESNPQDSHGKK